MWGVVLTVLTVGEKRANSERYRMGVEIEVDGVMFVEDVRPAESAVPRRLVTANAVSVDRRALQARLANWRKVVMGRAGGSAQYCAGWAKLYVSLRTDEAPPAEDVLSEKIKPLNPLVSADELDGWLVEAAWRSLGDYNERQALKALYIYRWPADQIRRFLCGVRGRHVPLIIAKAERSLESLLAVLGTAEAIRCTYAAQGSNQIAQIS